MSSRSRLAVAFRIPRVLLFGLSIAANAALLGSGPTCTASDCGCEGVCDCEPACGTEPVCGLEPVCGVEPQCGCDALSSCEPECGSDPDCGCDTSCSTCPSRCCDGGILGCNPLPSSGPVYRMLDGVACGLEKLLHLDPKCSPVQQCDCQTCGCNQGVMHSTLPYDSEWQSVPTPVQTPAPAASMNPPNTMAPRVPSLPSPGPLPTPRPIPITQPSAPEALPKPSGKPFDSLTNPFEDDSAMRIGRRTKAVQPASHDEQSESESGPFDDVDYEDYFR